MKKFALAALVACFFATASYAAPLSSGKVENTSPYNQNSMLLGMVQCPKVFRCPHPEESLELLVDEANKCAAQMFGLPPNLMTYYSSSGEFRDCAIPTSYVGDAKAKTAKWPICCLTTAQERGEEACRLECNLFANTN